LQQCRRRTLAKLATSISLFVPFMPNTNRSFVSRGPYKVSPSIQRRAHDAARLQQRMPIAAIARQPRRFNAKSYYQAEVNLEDLSEPGEAAIQTF
jgi:hypothetical protein